MKSILDLEKEYSASYHSQFNDYRTLFELIKKVDFSNIQNNDITKAILYRIKGYYQYQNEINQLLNRGIVPAASDIFTETVLFYLSAFLKSSNIPLIAKSEIFIGENLRIKPDISLWSTSGEFVGFIECKTQLGRSRDNWEENFESRVESVRKVYPNALSFLVVMTESNWQGFRNNPNVGRRYFCLLPGEIGINAGIRDLNFENEIPILNPIESLFEQIKKGK